MGSGQRPRETQPVDDGAYGRVTDAARYAVLHDAARELLDQLSRDYAVEVVTGPTVDEDLAGRTPTETTVRLQPSTGAGAPLTVAFTAFPGLMVRFGTWHVEAYPACGCDACDEEPADLIERLRGQVGVIVREGFTERLTHGRRRSVLTMEARGSRSEAIMSRSEGRRLGNDEVRVWSPWTAKVE